MQRKLVSKLIRFGQLSFESFARQIEVIRQPNQTNIEKIQSFPYLKHKSAVARQYCDREYPEGKPLCAADVMYLNLLE